jgi:hypothetical protein
MTTDVETIVSETIEKVNEWLRNAVTKKGSSVYRSFVLEEPHYRYDSGLMVETPEGKLFAHLMTYWDYICWPPAAGEEIADPEFGLAGDWFLQLKLTLTPTGPNSWFEHPDDDNPMVAVARDHFVEMAGFEEMIPSKLTVENVSHRPSYTLRGEVRRTHFREDMRLQLQQETSSQ